MPQNAPSSDEKVKQLRSRLDEALANLQNSFDQYVDRRDYAAKVANDVISEMDAHIQNVEKLLNQESDKKDANS